MIGLAGIRFYVSANHIEALSRQGFLNCEKDIIADAFPLEGKHAVRHWIFTPSSGRAGGPKQAFLNWSLAMGPDAEYVRVIVVKQSEMDGYLQMVDSITQPGKAMQITLIMTLPEKLSLQGLQKMSKEYRAAIESQSPDTSLGVGYARLCIQLVTRALGLSDVWMLDDNIQDGWQLNLQDERLRCPPHQHGQLQPCSFDSIMQGIEEHVSKTAQAEYSPNIPLEYVQRHWQPEQSPREPQAQAVPDNAVVRQWFEYSGTHSNYAIIGPSRQPYRYRLIGAKWPGGAGPPPFKITHSVFSFFLLNVEATWVGKELVLWPARQFAEDIEFHHLCEDNKLAVVKCNRFFFHKANLQGSDLKKVQERPKVVFEPAQGPMWGGQEVRIQMLPTPQHITSVAICGKDVSDVGHGTAAKVAVLSPPMSCLVPLAPLGSSNIVMTGSIVVECEGMLPLVALQQYSYHGLWRWLLGTEVDVTTAAAGKSIKQNEAFV